MDRPALRTGGSLALGVLALGAVHSGLALAIFPGLRTGALAFATDGDSSAIASHAGSAVMIGFPAFR